MIRVAGNGMSIVDDVKTDGQAGFLVLSTGRIQLAVLVSRGTFPALVTLDRDEALAFAAGIVEALQ